MPARRPNRPRNERGQVLALFVICLTVIILAVGLVIDGGTALLQRRAAQNASDFAALAGARVIAEWIGGDTTNGTDANVQAAITASISVNGGTALTFGAPAGPRYVASSGAATGYVGNGAIPATTVGVTVSSSRSWTPYFLGIIGVNHWTAGAAAAARGGYAAGGPSGAVFPAGIAEAFFSNNRKPCAGDISNDPSSPCYPQHLTPGNLNVPGGFGWLKFGCVGYGLGQVPPASNGGCQNNKPFLQTEIGPPPNSFGCCTQVNLGGLDQIGSLPGNKASADCSYYINNPNPPVTVPVWDVAGGTGSNAWYHIVGFAGFQLTGCDGGKDIVGVYRQLMWFGPTTTTPGFAGAPLAVQLVK
jgi:hypothetical protein